MPRLVEVALDGGERRFLDVDGAFRHAAMPELWDQLVSFDIARDDAPLNLPFSGVNLSRVELVINTQGCLPLEEYEHAAFQPGRPAREQAEAWYRSWFSGLRVSKRRTRAGIETCASAAFYYTPDVRSLLAAGVRQLPGHAAG